MNLSGDIQPHALAAPRQPPGLGFRRIWRHIRARHDRGDVSAMAAAELGDVVKMPGPPGKRIWLCTHPRDLKRVMITNASNYRKSYDYAILSRLLGKGLITSEGEVWLRDRRLQHPLFHGKALEQFFGTIVDCAQATVDRWQPGQEIQLENEMTRFTVHVIGERILSLDVREWTDEIVYHLNVCQRHIIDRVVSPIDWARFLPTPGERRFKKSLAALYGIIDELVARRSKLVGERHDLYSVLEPTGLPPDVLRDQLMTMFLVGHETSASTLSWIFYALATHPEIDARLAAESQAVLAEGPLGLKRLERLEYTTRVAKEGMRLYPPAPFQGREAIEADELGGYHVPKDTVVVISAYATHRRPDLWPEPLVFDPDRFAPERAAKHLPHQYIPFLQGPRACIGQHLAMWELQVGLAMIASRYRLRLVDERPITPVALISLRPSRPVVMRVEKREAVR